MKRLALSAIRFYQRRISGGLPPACPPQPTSPHSASESIETFGFFRGAAMAAWRILRCNPLNDGGFDPVPERTERAARTRA